MVLTTFEASHQAAEAPLDLRLVTPDDTMVFREWLDIRQEYVEGEGWHFGDDWDAYDSNPETLHILMQKEGAILAGMRLTPASDVRETLSWSMLTPAMRESAVGVLPERSDTRIWDITRLLSTSTDTKETMDAFVQMFAVGLNLNRQESADPRWYFTTTRSLYVYFKRKGIEFTPLARARISDSDKEESIFCYIDPAICLEKIQSCPSAHKDIFNAAVRGLALIDRPLGEL